MHRQAYCLKIILKSPPTRTISPQLDWLCVSCISSSYLTHHLRWKKQNSFHHQKNPLRHLVANSSNRAWKHTFIIYLFTVPAQCQMLEIQTWMACPLCLRSTKESVHVIPACWSLCRTLPLHQQLLQTSSPIFNLFQGAPHLPPSLA